MEFHIPSMEDGVVRPLGLLERSFSTPLAGVVCLPSSIAQVPRRSYAHVPGSVVKADVPPLPNQNDPRPELSSMPALGGVEVLEEGQIPSASLWAEVPVMGPPAVERPIQGSVETGVKLGPVDIVSRADNGMADPAAGISDKRARHKISEATGQVQKSGADTPRHTRSTSKTSLKSSKSSINV